MPSGSHALFLFVCNRMERTRSCKSSKEDAVSMLQSGAEGITATREFENLLVNVRFNWSALPISESMFMQLYPSG